MCSKHLSAALYVCLWHEHIWHVLQHLLRAWELWNRLTKAGLNFTALLRTVKVTFLNFPRFVKTADSVFDVLNEKIQLILLRLIMAKNTWLQNNGLNILCEHSNQVSDYWTHWVL